MVPCYTGKILIINLSSKESRIEELKEEDVRKFLGGRGLAAKILYQQVGKGIDAIGPDNKLIFMTGPLTGTIVPGSSRHVVVAKSPQTNLYGESYSGGYFAPEIKYAGYDGIIIEGCSDEPCMVRIFNDRADVLSARNLWGKPVHETEKEIKGNLGDDFKVACIGVAGEKLVKYSSIMNDIDRTAGRTGMGAVMGSKKLKAIAVRGTKGVRVFNPEELKRLVLSNTRIIRKTSERYMKLGTIGGITGLDTLGILPTENFNVGTFAGVKKINGECLKRDYLIRNKACLACTIGCIRVVRVDSGPFGGVMPCYGGPEYETTAALGSLCLNEHLDAICLANQLCNYYGIDTISMGNIIAFTMECYEKGLISKDDIGFEVRWGNPEAIIKLIHMVANREGFGDVLAEGVQSASRKIGGEACRYAVEGKGLEVPMHEPRGKKGLGLSYATSPRGAVHTEGFHDTMYMTENPAPEIGILHPMDRFSMEGKPQALKFVQDFKSFYNSLILCTFTVREFGSLRNVEEVIGMVRATTGFDIDINEALKIGERNFNTGKAFTVREGAARENDTLHEKFYIPMKEGASKGYAFKKDEISRALDEYYRFRGWNEDGIPTREKLDELGLDFIIRAKS